VKVEAHDFFVELLEIVPGRTAAPGERVTAKVRVGNARKDTTYRLSAMPSNDAVRILSHQEVIVRGSMTATYEFSSLVPGVAGIGITVDKLEGEDP
jgi:hypothetical protein